ncbi:MAG: hypothetical protein LUH36_05500 [Oscillospiraceae bacterium]|nr:hypothetical protein [Oscillospiraceae bacterium]
MLVVVYIGWKHDALAGLKINEARSHGVNVVNMWFEAHFLQNMENT